MKMLLFPFFVIIYGISLESMQKPLGQKGETRRNSRNEDKEKQINTLNKASSKNGSRRQNTKAKKGAQSGFTICDDVSENSSDKLSRVKALFELSRIDYDKCLNHMANILWLEEQILMNFILMRDMTVKIFNTVVPYNFLVSTVKGRDCLYIQKLNEECAKQVDASVAQGLNLNLLAPLVQSHKLSATIEGKLSAVVGSLKKNTTKDSKILVRFLSNIIAKNHIYRKCHELHSAIYGILLGKKKTDESLCWNDEIIITWLANECLNSKSEFTKVFKSILFQLNGLFKNLETKYGNQINRQDARKFFDFTERVIQLYKQYKAEYKSLYSEILGEINTQPGTKEQKRECLYSEMFDKQTRYLLPMDIYRSTELETIELTADEESERLFEGEEECGDEDSDEEELDEESSSHGYKIDHEQISKSQASAPQFLKYAKRSLNKFLPEFSEGDLYHTYPPLADHFIRKCGYKSLYENKTYAQQHDLIYSMVGQIFYPKLNKYEDVVFSICLSGADNQSTRMCYHREFRRLDSFNLKDIGTKAFNLGLPKTKKSKTTSGDDEQKLKPLQASLVDMYKDIEWQEDDENVIIRDDKNNVVIKLFKNSREIIQAAKAQH